MSTLNPFDAVDKAFGLGTGPQPQEAQRDLPAFKLSADDAVGAVFGAPPPEQEELRAVLRAGADAKPDDFAKAARLAKTTGVPEDVVVRNLRDVELQNIVMQADQQLQTSPKLAQAMRERPALWPQAKDDIEPLGKIEALFNVVRSLPTGAARGTEMALRGAGELIDVGARAIDSGVRTVFGDTVADAFWFELSPEANAALNPAEAFRTAGRGWGLIADAIGVDAADANFATDVAEGIGQLAGQIVAYRLTGPTAATGLFVAQGAGQMADRVEDDEASRAAKDVAILTGATVTAALERLGIDQLLNRMPPKIKNDAMRWVADKMVAGGVEAAQETAESLLQDLTQYLLTNQDVEFGEGLGYEATVAGTAAAIVRAATGARIRSDAQEREREKAEAEAARLQQLMVESLNSKLRERNPDEFREVVQRMADSSDDAPKSIFIDAQVLNQAGVDVGALLPSVAAQMEEALATNATVEVPLGELLTAAPGTPLEQLFLQNGRSAPDAPSLADVEQARAQADELIKQEADRIIAEASEESGMIQSRQAVLDNLKSQLDSVGRFAPDVNETYATLVADFYTVMAQRRGMTPDQLFQLRPLQIRGGQQQQATEGYQSADTSAFTPEEATIAQEAEARVANEPQLVDDYIARFGQVVDPDQAKQMFEAYNADPGRMARVVHEASSALAKKVYERILADNPGAPVLFTAGGGGSGKSEAMPMAMAAMGREGGGPIYDSTLSSIESAVRRIEQALAAGNPVDIIYTNRPVDLAFEFAMGRSRVVPIPVLARAHVDASNTIRELARRYEGDDRVQIAVVNNLGALDEMAVGDIADVFNYEYNDVERRLYAQAQQALSEGRITQERFDTLVKGTSQGQTGSVSGRVQGGEQGPQLGRPGEGPGSQRPAVKPGQITVEVYHYSKAQRDTVSTSMFGTGLQGSGREQYQNAADPRLRRRAYFYADKGTGINPEAGVGGFGHRATLTNIYDSNADPLRLKRGRDQLGFESAVLDAGFDGYLDRLSGSQSAQVIVLGNRTVPVESLGSLGKTRGAVVSAPQRTAPRGRDVAVEAIEANRDLPAGELSLDSWSMILERRMPEVHAELDAMGVFEGEGRFYKDGLVRRILEMSESPVYEQRAKKNAKPNPAVPPSVAAVSNVESAFELAGSREFGTNRELKLALQERVQAALKAAKVDLSNFDQATQDYLTQMILTDAEVALRTNPNAVGWYNEKVTKALRVVALIHPEINTDPQARFAFTWAMAVTSNGLKVDKNFELAERAYQGYKATGVMPTNIGIGTAAGPINDGLKAFNAMMDRHGFAALETFMTTKDKVKNIEAFTGVSISGEGANTEVYGAAILGPKIGNGFFANLYGKFEQLTMDRWLMRTWGRWTGTLVEVDAAKVKAKSDQLVGLVKLLTPADKKAFEAILKQKISLRDPKGAAEVILKASTKPANRERMNAIGLGNLDAIAGVMGPARTGVKRVGLGDELRKAGNNLARLVDGQKEAPAGSRERDNIRSVFQSALQQLQQNYPQLTMSDLQALLWYPEKRLYDAAKTTDDAETGYEDDAAPDYANAAVALALSQGVDQTAIDAVLQEIDNEIAARNSAEPAGRSTGGVVEQTGDGSGRYASRGLAPLEGAPAVAGASGPDPRLVAVAEQYAERNGIDLRRQGVFVEVDPERASRIAAAYDAMPHAPQDPAVQEAYQNLIAQTRAQYDALVEAGYTFTFFDSNSDPYASNPWNAMRDLRANQTMAVYGTYDGFGTDATIDVTDNPMLAETGLQWPDQQGVMRPVLANDLFRAVHDAFGHGLEGAGFRARGEENAWQAHVRLFTGSAVAAITTETRGQNSWLNFGPYGESNRNASVENTVFAPQKTGLMPEFTWTEGRAPDMEPPVQAQVAERPLEQSMAEDTDGQVQFLTERAQAAGFSDVDTFIDQDPAGFDAAAQEWRAMNPAEALMQGPRGTFNPRDFVLTLNENADLSTFLHETGHFFLEMMAETAADPNAPADVAQDMGKVLKWFGVDSLDTWRNMTLDQKRPHHERFAESFEQYLFEGKAPSKELQPLFRRFKQFMFSVYKSLTNFMRQRDLRLSNEIRGVFDRMLASEQQIREAEDLAGMLPDFEATNEAIEKLQARSLRDMKWLANARSRKLKELQKEAAALRKEVEAEVAAEVDATPEMRAKAALDGARKAQGGGDLNEATMAAIADSFGYESSDAMLQAIDAYGKRADVVEGMTDQRMLERFGDLATPEARERAANEAIHNEARARALATELVGQAEAMNPRQQVGVNARGARQTVNALVEAAKLFATNLADRRRVRDLRGAVAQHRAAELRAARAADAATRAGDTRAAVRAKQDQLLNNYATKSLMEAQAEVEKIFKLFDRVTKGNNEDLVKSKRDPDVVNAARAILAAYGVSPRLEKGAQGYLEILQRNDPAMYNAVAPSVEAALLNAQPVDMLTMEELRGLREEIDSLWHLAKRSRQMEVDGNMLDLDDASAELRDRMATIGVPLVMPGETRALSAMDKAKRKLQFAASLLRRAEQWAIAKDGKWGGPFTKLVFQPVKQAADRYRADRVKARRQFTALVEQLAPTMVRGEIAAPEIGYTFTGGDTKVGISELLHAIIHTGNDSNKRKLLLGRGWATEGPNGELDTSRWDAFIQRMWDTGVLNKAHYDFAQGVWDLLESLKPAAQKAHRDVYGRYFEEVTANSFETPFGSYRGGYAPAQVDTDLVTDAALRKLAEQENENMAYSFPAANRGFTKSRVEYNRPLKLDLRSLTQHLDKVLLFTHMQPAINDVNRLLMRKEVSYDLSRIDPTAYEGMLVPWLNRSAKQIVETPVTGDGGISSWLSTARNRAGMSLMMANLSNTFQQVTGFSSAAAIIPMRQLMKATAQYTASPRKMAADVRDASAFMRDRMENEIAAITNAMDDILLDPTLYQSAQAWTQKHAYFMQAAADNVLSPIVWTAAYNHGIEQGMTPEDAAQYGDSIVRQTQTTTLPEDVSRIETGPAYARLFTQFLNYFNTIANTNATALMNIQREVGLRKGAGKALGVAFFGVMVPAALAEAIALAFRGGPEDEDEDGWYLDDWISQSVAMGTLKFMLAGIPFAGQFAVAGMNRFNDVPYDDKVSLSPAISLLESAVGAPYTVYKAMMDEGSVRRAVNDVGTLVAMITGLPTRVLARPIGYLAGVANDEIEPTSAVDAARGLVTGVPSPESRQ